MVGSVLRPGALWLTSRSLGVPRRVGSGLGIYRCLREGLTASSAGCRAVEWECKVLPVLDNYGDPLDN
jgi:hypothetical protein